MTQSNDEVIERLPPEEDHLQAEEDHVPSELNSLISDEVLRTRVQKIIDVPPPKSMFRKIVDHPVFTLVLSVVLTFMFSTVLARQGEHQRLEVTRQIEEERRKKESLMAAYNDFLSALSEQKARALLVDHAIQFEGLPNELSTLLRNEQEAFAKSQQKAAVLSFTIRDLVSPEVYERIHNSIQDGLIEPLDEAMRAHAFIYSKLSSRSNKDDWKNTSSAINYVGMCGTAVSHAVWYNTLAPRSTNSDSISRKEESMKDMEEMCKR